ncbi:MAG: hypothetical protein FWC70_08380 [Defluviitaleaceae bacterium]|nr:hypothetical protein [Defluviitaleaceae bacterium]
MNICRYAPGLDADYFDGLLALITNALCKIRYLEDTNAHLRSVYVTGKDYTSESELLDVCCECIYDGVMPNILQILIEYRATEILSRKELPASRRMGVILLKSIAAILQSHDIEGLYCLIGAFCSHEARFNIVRSLLFEDFHKSMHL